MVYKAKDERGIPKAALSSNSIPNNPSSTSVLYDLGMLALKLVSIFLIFTAVFIFLFGIVRYNEPYMDPAIKDGDLVIYYRYKKAGYSPSDIVILEVNGEKQARRVIANAGDTIDITESGLIINGAVQQEIGIYRATERYEEGVEFPLTVPEGHVFLLADYRTDATDSRVYGCVSIDKTAGKVITVIRRRSF